MIDGNNQDNNQLHQTNKKTTKLIFLEWVETSNSILAKFLNVFYQAWRKIKYWRKLQITVREIQEIAEIFYANNCVWSLQSANVLGIYRNGRFVKNEEDVDMAVLAEDWTIDIEEEIRRQGFNLSVYCGGYSEGSEGVHMLAQKRGLAFDIYPIFKDKCGEVEYRWYGGNHYYRYYFEPRLLEKTKTVKFYGVKVEIPEDTDTYLKSIYGDDYMIPNEKWDWRNDPKCRLRREITYLSQTDVDCYLQRKNSDAVYSS